MGRAGKEKTNKLPDKPEDKPVKFPAARRNGEDDEDGDIATPKRDRSDEDDQPL